jgi:hypothetical protein
MIERALQSARPSADDLSCLFDPGWLLPAPSPELTQFTSVSSIGVTDLGTYRGRTLRLLDLMRNPATRTTKTLPSLVIVARAVRYIHDTGEPIMIVTPSSANKATALRDAVYRAITSGLVSPGQLKITTVVPPGSSSKLWLSPLSADPDLRDRNPMVLYGGNEPADVKVIAQEFTESCAAAFHERYRVNLWYTLSLDNYRPADTARAYFEREFLPRPDPPGRLHVHAVSSAFGLLGHNFGHLLCGEDVPLPRYFLVQHLGAPDMVLSLHYGDTDLRHMPRYSYDKVAGLHCQDADPRFPSSTLSLDEVLDSTFYTRQPSTSAEMNDIIHARGGGGIVVSLHECLNRYGQARALLANSDIDLPSDPRLLREWSLVMALTGTLNAIDRDLIDRDEDILVHGSGCYSVNDFLPLPADHMSSVTGVSGLAEAVSNAIERDAAAC